jgi:outer membrane protein
MSPLMKSSAAIAASLLFSVSIGSARGLAGYAGYDRLLRDAAESPIIRRFGSRNQVSAGMGLTYTFQVKER